MKRYLYALRYLVSIHLLGLLFFAAFRLILFMQGYDYLAGENLSVLTRAEAFARGVWLDNVVACYIMILPLTVVSICALLGYYGKALFRGVGIFFSLFYVLAFAISAADIPYFAYFFKHINASIFNWFGYAGTTLGLMFGEFSYIVAFVLFLALSILFVFLLRWLRQRTCLDIHRVSDEKFHWPNELLMLLGSIVLIGGCMFGIRGRVGYNPIKVSAAYYCNNTFLNQLGVSPAFNLLRSSLEASKSENREIDLMDDQRGVTAKGGTMRLGAYPCLLRPGSLSLKLYGGPEISERHRHRYEFNNLFREQLERAGLRVAGTSPNDKLVEMVELPGLRFFVGCQFHPEFKSRPTAAHPLFSGLIHAALERQNERG